MLNTEYRLYDPRLAQWLTRDPVFQPWESPYSAMAGNPILFSDPQGDTPGTEHTPQAEAEGGGGNKLQPNEKQENTVPFNEKARNNKKIQDYAKRLTANHNKGVPEQLPPDVGISAPVTLVLKNNGTVLTDATSYFIVSPHGIVGEFSINIQDGFIVISIRLESQDPRQQAIAADIRSAYESNNYEVTNVDPQVEAFGESMYEHSQAQFEKLSIGFDPISINIPNNKLSGTQSKTNSSSVKAVDNVAKQLNENEIAKANSWEAGRNLALTLTNTGEGSKPLIGRLKASKGYGKVIGRTSKDKKVRWRLDWDQTKGLHINIEYKNNPDADGYISLPGDEKTFQTLLKQLQ